MLHLNMSKEFVNEKKNELIHCNVTHIGGYSYSWYAVKEARKNNR